MKLSHGMFPAMIVLVITSGCTIDTLHDYGHRDVQTDSALDTSGDTSSDAQDVPDTIEEPTDTLGDTFLDIIEEDGLQEDVLEDPPSDEAEEEVVCDFDGDGHEALWCSGDDCDDSDDSVYAGADETECDLVDSDCDGDDFEHIDDDDDGWIDETCSFMVDTTGYEGTGDCDDTDGSAYPGAAEGCDGTIDNDCDGNATEVEFDVDGDGHPPLSCGGDDCDDTDETVYPGALEVCDLVDDNCDGEWNDATDADDDSDGYLDHTCIGGDDCDDTNGSIFPGAEELCNFVDDDCDGQPDEDFKTGGTVFYTDWNGSTLFMGESCGTGPCTGGTVVCNGTGSGLYCDTSIYMETELCNFMDDDCDGGIDEDFKVGGTVFYTDWNGSTRHLGDDCGVGICAGGIVVCLASGLGIYCPGYASALVDDMICNSTDDDCDGVADDDWLPGGAGVPYTDWDGSFKYLGESCGTGACAGGTVECRSDQADITCNSLFYVTEETCDSIDNDCDGSTDEGC